MCVTEIFQVKSEKINSICENTKIIEIILNEIAESSITSPHLTAKEANNALETVKAYDGDITALKNIEINLKKNNYNFS